MTTTANARPTLWTRTQDGAETATLNGRVFRVGHAPNAIHLKLTCDGEYVATFRRAAAAKRHAEAVAA